MFTRSVQCRAQTWEGRGALLQSSDGLEQAFLPLYLLARVGIAARDTVLALERVSPLSGTAQKHRGLGRLESPVWVLSLLALWLLVSLGWRPLLLPDEGRYGNVAREMLAGDWMVPTLNGLPFFHKPPLLYWLDMAAMQLFGVTAFAARFGPALGAWLMGASLYLGMRHWQGPRAAVLALGLLATCPLYFVSAQYANHDMLVAGFITATTLGWVRALDTPGRAMLGWLLLGWLACALAVLSKGLIGLVLSALVVGPWLIVQGRWARLLRLLHPAGLLVFALVALPWFVAMQVRYPGFFDYFVMEQHFRRFALSTFNNVQPFWFFLAVLPVLTLPWSAWLLQAFRLAWAGRDVRAALCVWWVLAVIGFFSLPSSKIVGYVLPALAPWCALLALALTGARPRLVRWVMGCSALLCLLIVAALAWQAPTSNRRLALALAADIAPGERVVMVDDYLSDVPFYARLAQPVRIAGNWTDPELPRRDNWRKEVFDAGRFDPERARALLWPLNGLEALACGESGSWFIVRQGQAQRVASLPGAAQKFADARFELWHTSAYPCR